MGAYNKIRASSPGDDEEGRGRDSLELSDLEDDAAEQNEGLLAVKQGDVEKAEKRGGPAKGVRRSRRWPVVILTVIVLMTIVVLDLQLFMTPDKTKVVYDAVLEHLLNRPIRRPDEDYVLDMKWDVNAAPRERVYNWTIVDKDASPDGIFKTMTVINGQFPGPLIEVNEGDTIVVDVHNRGVNASSIHWHGIFHNGTNFMDGAPGVTQCPIAPGQSFRYKFTVTGQTGTYFYHGHQGTQRLDGLVGPIVIHGKQDTQNVEMPYFSDRVVLLQDWYYDPGSLLLREKLSPGSETSPTPNTALINGVNQVNCSLHPNRRCNTTQPFFPTIDVTPGSLHRLRFINVGAFAWFQVQIDEHQTLPIVEIDGTPVKPTPETIALYIAPGQRYSVVFPTDQGYERYWLRARMIKACFSSPAMPEDGNYEAKAILRYVMPSSDGSQEKDTAATAVSQQVLPTTEPSKYIDEAMTCKDMSSTHPYVPLPAQPAPAVADHSWYLRVNMAIGNWRLERGFLNDSSFRPMLNQPILHRIIDGLAAGNNFFAVDGVNSAAFTPKSELVISHRKIETVDVILQNVDEGNHPFHLHGSKMWILGAGHGYFPGYAALGLNPEGKGLLDPNNATVIANPLKRDTATAEGFGWVLLRFVADNPGVWMFHCHMFWHSESGMAMQFVSRADDLRGWTVPEESRRLCQVPLVELERGAGPKDDEFYGFKNGGGRLKR